MAEISVEQIKELRARTQASLADCRAALEEAGGDIEEAAKRLRVRGAAIAEKRGDRATSAGMVEAYIHGNGQIGVLVDLRSETDFVSRSDEFRALAHDLALHIAAASPRYLSADEIPDEVKTEEKRLIEEQYKDSGKPANVVEKIVEGKLNSLTKDTCLLAQPFVKDPSKTIQNLVDEAVAKFGEKVVVKRFSRFQI